MAAETSTILAHRTVPRGDQRAFPHFVHTLSCRLDPPQTDDACWLHTSTASLIDLTCPLTTFTELSSAPLDCGPPSANVSCRTTPVQAHFTAVSNARMKGSVSHRNTTLWYLKLSKSSTLIFSTFLQLGKSTPCAGIQRATFDFVTPSCITKSRRCSTSAGVSRLDLALGHKLHTMTENLHALSADGPRFLRTLDLTSRFTKFVTDNGFGVVGASLSHFVSHVNLLHVQSTSDPGFEVLNSPNGPISFFFSGFTGGPSSLCLVLGPFKELPVDGVSSDSHVCKTETPSIFRMQWYASLNPCDGLAHRCNTGTHVWQYERSTYVEDHNVAFVNHS